MGLWRIDVDTPRRLGVSTLPSEATLEEYLEGDPSLLGDRLLVIGRQVRTPHGKYIDLLAMDAEGSLHVLELKRDKTPRDVVAQVLDYGSWVSTLDRDTIIDLANEHLDVPFESAFEGVFGTSAPDGLNAALQLTIVATDLDAGSERIVTYLRSFGVPVNAVFFSYLEDDGRTYLARTWLVSDDDGSSAKRPRGKKADWNGQDWYVNFGENEQRGWEDARRYGFVSAGGGDWYSRTLKNVPVGARIFAYLPQKGYVGVGTTLREALPFDRARILTDGEWERLADQPLVRAYQHESDGSEEDFGEYVVPVRWEVTVPAAEAYRESGMFASTHSACKLRQEFTLERLTKHFKIDEDGG